MLHSVFKDLYDQGVLVFLDTKNYVTNTCGSPECFEDRERFLREYGEPVEIGWVWCYTTSLNDVFEDFDNDACHLIEYGFNGDSDRKTSQLGQTLVVVLNKYGFIAKWDEKALVCKKISTVISRENLPAGAD